MIFDRQSGAIAPLAMIFAFVSMLVTVAYLGNTVSTSSQEKFRHAEVTAKYIAEAGLYKEAADYLPKLSGADTTLIGDSGLNYGEDSKGNPLGIYKNVVCGTQIQENSTQTLFFGRSTGVVSYPTANGNIVSVERHASLTMRPQTFGDFMYFTDDEEPGGPNSGTYVSFGTSDNLQGKTHTNSPTVTFSNSGCPDMNELHVTEDITFEGNTDCLSQLVDEDGESIIDTVAAIVYPPENSASLLRANARRIFKADELITFLPGRQDTLIMTEIEFKESGGYYATQWWYLIPPVVDAPPKIDFSYDATSTGQGNILNGSCQLSKIDMDTGTTGEAFDDIDLYDNTWILQVDGRDSNGDLISVAMTQLQAITNFMNPTEVILKSDGEYDKEAAFYINNVIQNGDMWLLVLVANTIVYTTNTNPQEGFSDAESVYLTWEGDSDALNVDVPFNAFEYFHNHQDADDFMCTADGFHHFDYRYWLCDDRYNAEECKEEETDRSYIYSERTFYSYSGPEVIYVRGGPALVHGTVRGQYTVVTDDSVEYRRHDNASRIDQIFGNIWIIDDIVYEDSDNYGAVPQPDENAMNPQTNNVLGLVAGGNIILANTAVNGARNRNQGTDIIVNASLMALHGVFLSQYWQNSVQSNNCPTCALPNSSQPWFSLGDGRGGHRNPVRPETANGNYTANIDYRGYVRVWGSIVQQKRGYMKRNSPCSNPIPGGDCYTSQDIGYDKDYNYDMNLRYQPPPYFPSQINISGQQILTLQGIDTLDE